MVKLITVSNASQMRFVMDNGPSLRVCIVCVCVCVCVCPPIRTYKDQNVFTHLRYEDHRIYEDRYLVLVNFNAPNGLKR